VVAAVVGLVAGIGLPEVSAAAVAARPGSAPTIKVGSAPDGVAVDPSTHTVYVINQSHYLSVIDESGDARTGTVTATTVIPYHENSPGDYPGAVAVDPSTHTVYVTTDDTVLAIDESGDARSGTITATIPVGNNLYWLAVDPSTHAVYVTDADDHVGSNIENTLSVIDESGDARSGTVTATIPVGAYPAAVAVDPTTHTVYVTNLPDRTVSVVDESGDTHSGTVTATIPVGTYPDAVAVDPTTHTVYVANNNDKTVSVIDESGDAHSGTVTGAILVGAGSTAAAIDPARPTVYVTNSSDNTVSVITPADVTLTVSGPPNAPVGSQFNETVTIADNGPAPAPGTVTNLEIPAGLTVIFAPAATKTTGTLIWHDNLTTATKATHTVTFAVAANAPPTTPLGGVAISSTTSDPNSANNAAIALIRLR
jgi:YVTN family beta-propeller protein